MLFLTPVKGRCRLPGVCRFADFAAKRQSRRMPGNFAVSPGHLPTAIVLPVRPLGNTEPPEGVNLPVGIVFLQFTLIILPSLQGKGPGAPVSADKLPVLAFPGSRGFLKKAVQLPEPPIEKCTVVAAVFLLLEPNKMIQQEEEQQQISSNNNRSRSSSHYLFFAALLLPSLDPFKQ